MELTPQVIQLFAIAAVIAFVADFIGNLITFRSKIGNALVSALVFGAMFVGANIATGADPLEPQRLQILVTGVIIFFIVCWIGNLIAFGNRFVNALVTALVYVALFGAAYYFAVTSGAMPTLGA